MSPGFHYSAVELGARAAYDPDAFGLRSYRTFDDMPPLLQRRFVKHFARGLDAALQHQPLAPARSGLTPRQAEAFDFIRQYIERTGASPAYSEITDHLKLKSKSCAFQLVRNIQRRGWLTHVPGKPRSIQLTGE